MRGLGLPNSGIFSVSSIFSSIHFTFIIKMVESITIFIPNTSENDCQKRHKPELGFSNDQTTILTAWQYPRVY